MDVIIFNYLLHLLRSADSCVSYFAKSMCYEIHTLFAMWSLRHCHMGYYAFDFSEKLTLGNTS